jgi:glycosyltransferase involved in cell wall biosynthesis
VNDKVGGKTEVLYNWIAKNSHSPCSINIQNTCLAGRKVLVYAGNMGIAQNLDLLINLANKTSNLSDIGYLLVGRGSEVGRLKMMCKYLELSNILFHEEIESSEIDGLLKQCHVGLISLDMRHQTHNIPGKFLSYLRAGLPIIASVDSKSDLSEMIRSQKVGFVMPNFNYEACITAFQMLDNKKYYRDMQSNALNMVENYFSVESAAQSILRSLK